MNAYPNMIKNLSPSLGERGKIKVGRKGQVMKSSKGNEFQPPQKLDHFLITTMQRGTDGNFAIDSEIHGQLGPKPKEIPVRLLYDDIDLNFQCRYTCYKGRQRWCVGDGERATRIMAPGKTQIVPCPCERQAPDYSGPDKCKINGCLSVIIDGAATVGGVWRFRTTSYNSTMGILSSLSLIKSVTGGPLAGIPLMMTLTPKTVANPVDGKSQTVFVVGLEYRGGVDELRQIGFDVAMKRQTHQIRMEDIEKQARKLLAYEDPVNDEDTVDEFYPDQGAEAESATMVKPEPEAPPPPDFEERRANEEDVVRMTDFLEAMSAHHKVDVETIQQQAAATDEAWAELMKTYRAWCKKHPVNQPAEEPEAPESADLTAYEAEAKRCDDAGDVTEAMAEALEKCGLTNMPTKTADKHRVGAALTLQVPDPA